MSILVKNVDHKIHIKKYSDNIRIKIVNDEILYLLDTKTITQTLPEFCQNNDTLFQVLNDTFNENKHEYNIDKNLIGEESIILNIIIKNLYDTTVISFSLNKSQDSEKDLVELFNNAIEHFDEKIEEIENNLGKVYEIIPIFDLSSLKTRDFSKTNITYEKFIKLSKLTGLNDITLNDSFQIKKYLRDNKNIPKELLLKYPDLQTYYDLTGHYGGTPYIYKLSRPNNKNKLIIYKFLPTLKIKETRTNLKFKFFPGHLFNMIDNNTNYPYYPYYSEYRGLPILNIHDIPEKYHEYFKDSNFKRTGEYKLSDIIR